MNQQQAASCRSLHLKERTSAAGNVLALPAREEEVAERRLATWRSQTPFQLDEWFERRLLQDGLTRESFLHLLGIADVCAPPEWEARLEEEYSSAERDGSAGRTLPVRAGAFTPLVRPLVKAALDRVRKAVRELKRQFPAAPFDPETAASLVWSGMEERLDWMLSRSVVLELYVARLQEALPGETPEARFQDFVERLGSPARALAFFREYPVLGRIVVESLDLWEEASRELLSRLARDWEEILVTFQPAEDPGPLESMEGGVGDLHCRGRSARTLVFQSGFRLSYKPRPVAINSRFTELVDWLNERGAPELAAARVLEREGYGWMEFITPRPCGARSELESFYRRQGAFLALFYALNANDLHRENLIAAGEHPIFIDLECLLAPDYGQFDPNNYDSPAHFELNNSVMRVMLLPFFHGNEKQEVLEPSGLGGEAGQVSVHEIPLWERPGTDEMRLTQGRPLVPPAQNRPTLRGETINPSDFRASLEEGFASLYELLVRHRDELLSAGSPLARFVDAEVRIVFRASQNYAFILNESFHPDLLRDALDRDRHFDRLWFGIDRSRLSEVALQLLPVEGEDLWRGDIPYFSARAGSRDVRGSGGEPLPGLLPRSGLEMAEARLRQLGEKDLRTQLWYIRASMTALAIDLQSPPPESSVTRLPSIPAGRDGFLAAAMAISERLGELALRRDGQAGWLGLAKTRSRGWWLRPLDADLYSGLPGVALYLAHSGEILQESEHTLLARQALANLDRQLDRRERVSFVGAFDGWGGLVYTWLHLGRLWQDDSLVRKAVEALPKIAALIDCDEDLDLIRGCAGGIVPLLSLCRDAGSEQALDLARRMGDRIVAEAHPYKDGVCWKTASFPVHPLTGFSHGSSGFAWSLLELYGATGDERYRETAVRALAFESEFFSPEERNWRDLRPAQWELGTGDYSEIAGNVAWCHGSTGIGLSRLRMLACLDDPEILQDVKAATETNLRRGFGVNHSLCHGDLGNLELIVQAGRVLGDAGWQQAAEEKAQDTLRSIEEKGCLCGVPFYVETPGLMEGLAGIGYGLLRLAEPDRVPCVLLLDLP